MADEEKNDERIRVRVHNHPQPRRRHRRNAIVNTDFLGPFEEGVDRFMIMRPPRHRMRTRTGRLVSPGVTINFNVINRAPAPQPMIDAFDFFTGLMTIPHVPRGRLRIPSEKFDDDEDEEHKCPICLCMFERGEDVTLLDCAHLFHTPCIRRWGERKATCPSCRATIQIEHGFGELML